MISCVHANRCWSLCSVLATASPRPGAQRCASSRAAVAEEPSGYHVPVLLDEVMSWLLTDPAGEPARLPSPRAPLWSRALPCLAGTYADGTLGGGGHSAAMLEVLAPNGGRLIGVDRDPDALREAGARLKSYTESGHATLVHSSFGSMPDALRSAGLKPVTAGGGVLDGLLLDLGVSSHQLDCGARGFSFMRDGPLDMRMDQGSGGRADASLTAAELVNTWEAKDISRVLWEFGDEKDSRRIARALVAARPLHTTSELAAALAAAAPPGPPKAATKSAARVFQALRIAVNGEMEQLDTLLSAAASLIRPGGRLAVLSYHSLEDRRVKRLLRSGRLGGDSPPRDTYGNSLSPWTPLTRQPVVASDEEVARNPRARSAKLRVGERTVHAPYD